MEFREFGTKGRKKILLIPGTMMSWRQFDTVIPYLEKKYHVIAVSTDGFDGTGRTTFTTAEDSARKIAAYINEQLDGNIQLVFGESFGCASAAALAQRQACPCGQYDTKRCSVHGLRYIK